MDISSTAHIPLDPLTYRRRLRAEWEEQAAILLAFPHEYSDWHSKIDEARACFLHIIDSITAFEPVLLCIDSRDTKGLEILCKHMHTSPKSLHEAISSKENAPALYPLTSRITLAFLPTNDTWARDFGALTCEVLHPPQSPLLHANNTPSNLLLDFCFNGWGGKFTSVDDNAITHTLHQLGALGPSPLESHPFVLEGGSIDTDGYGSILTTTACLLESKRNPNHTKAHIEAILRQTLGAKRVLWLEHGFLLGDDTDSHIDMLARFLSPSSIAYIGCDDINDPHYETLRAMERELQALRTPSNMPYTLVKLPFVKAIYDEEKRLPASYANFLFINGALLVPTYNDPSDALALNILQAHVSRKVIGIPATTLIKWHGSLHCISMQLYPC